ncbi:hypothetical protein MTR67_030326 [Solanum verrucosum]|uniref:Uncharacterized protein n=1 Tax=Solanum verrucosum TaxID=315347 RepID=A0AAF0RDT0_SOLVR|nr:hypothetical protein MTR67_030326 [Solanum verrucosum]
MGISHSYRLEIA